MRRPSKRSRRILIAIMYAAIYSVMQIFVQGIFVFYHRMNGFLNENEIFDALLSGSFAISVIAAVLSLWIYIVIGAIIKRPAGDYVHNDKITPMAVIMLCCAAIGSRCVVSAFYHFAKTVPLLKKSIEQSESLAPDSLLWYQALIAMLTVIIIAPLFEEFLFRFLILGELRSIMRPWAAVFFQAILFGAAHMALFQSIFAFIMGVLLGIISLRTKSIKACAICHATFNFSSFMTPEKLSAQTSVILVVFGILLTASAMTYIIATGKK